jgi:hypothetical protein
MPCMHACIHAALHTVTSNKSGLREVSSIMQRYMRERTCNLQDPSSACTLCSDGSSMSALLRGCCCRRCWQYGPACLMPMCGGNVCSRYMTRGRTSCTHATETSPQVRVSAAVNCVTMRQTDTLCTVHWLRTLITLFGLSAEPAPVGQEQLK